jgi:ureidoglycolate lyase
MIVQTLPIAHPVHLTAVPLTREAFSPFGSVLTNPAPASLPSATVDATALPCGAAVANQGTAIQYRQLGATHDLYARGGAPSRAPATPRTTMFVCRGRLNDNSNSSSRSGAAELEIKMLERHPFTTQTFVPLSSSEDATTTTRYLVVVAPSLAPGALDDGLPVPTGTEAAALGLPGRGLPDLSRLRAFVATGRQAVTYGAGTWHAPMIALVRPDTAIDFVVVQFANGTAVEDCQEVALESGGSADKRIRVQVPPEQLRLSKL